MHRYTPRFPRQYNWTVKPKPEMSLLTFSAKTGDTHLHARTHTHARTRTHAVANGVWCFYHSLCLPNISPVQYLYEVGGNICESDVIAYTHDIVAYYIRLTVIFFYVLVRLLGERRLHPDCILLEVHRVNPHCDWLIKPWRGQFPSLPVQENF